MVQRGIPVMLTIFLLGVGLTLLNLQTSGGKQLANMMNHILSMDESGYMDKPHEDLDRHQQLRAHLDSPIDPKFRIMTSVTSSKTDVDESKNNNNNADNAAMDEARNEAIKKDDKPMNIVLLYGDDWRHDSIGSSKKSIVKTPFFDWLADQGIRFVRNCVTTSVCWISRANMYTGQYVSRHNSTYPQHDNWYAFWDVSWPAMLRKAGYYIGHVGKWHSPWISTVWNTWHFGRPYYGQHWYEERGKKIHTTKKNEIDALEFLRKRPKNKPFMLNVCFFAPHSVDGTDEQYFPQNESMSLYVDDYVDVPLSATPEEWQKMPPFFTSINEGRTRWKIRFDTPEKYQRMMKNYYRLITEIDQTSEKIFEELKKQGVENNTMIIFSTDNGLFHSEHQMAGKWYPHEESIRVPLVIYDPRMPKHKVGTLNDEFTLNIDLASTILGAAGLKSSSVMQGRDISDLYLTKSPKWRQEFFYEHPMHLEDKIIPASSALVRKGMKYMFWPDHEYEQLFDLKKDPLEMQDLAREANMQEVLKEMRIRHNELKLAALQPGPIDETGEKIRGTLSVA